ncbi:MAG: hypothetical protein H0U52_00580 [Chloroflexi bacterium]|nr:hypothetical protein [Chloroflexota bacterium]
MSKRLNGTDTKDAEYPRDPFGWYVETAASVDQLADAIDFRDSLIWDPSCGSGNILDVFARRGHPTIGSDVIDRFKPGGHRFYRGSFLSCTKWPTMGERPLSIVCNPPYNEPAAGMAEAFIWRTLQLVPFYRAAFLVPLEFQCGQGRYEKFYAPKPAAGMRPSHVASLMERPSMPPGEMLSALGESCRKGGMADYCWIIYTAGGPYQTEHLFLRPTPEADLDLSARRKRADRNAGALPAIGTRTK